MHEEGLEPPHLAVPEPKGHIDAHDGAGSGNCAGRDAGGDTNVHEGPGVGAGWAAGQGMDQQTTGVVPARAWAVRSVRAFNVVVLAALERRDIHAAWAAAHALAELLN